MTLRPYVAIFASHQRLIRWFSAMDLAYCLAAVPCAGLVPARDLGSMVATVFGMMLLWIAFVMYHATGYERFFSSFRLYLVLPLGRASFFRFSLLLPMVPFVGIYASVLAVFLAATAVLPHCPDVRLTQLWWVFAFGVFAKTTSLPLLLLSRKHPAFMLSYIAALSIVGVVVSIIHEIFLPRIAHPLELMSGLFLLAVFAFSARVVRAAW